MVDILEDLSDGENDLPLHQITINEHYAQAYAAKKEREEQSKLKDLYGSDLENLDELEDDSESETEDEDGEELTPAVDAAILRTLSKITKRDPEIYNPTKDVFAEEKQRTSASTPWGYKTPKEKSKPLTIKQQNMESLLGHGSGSRGTPEPVVLTHVEEQNALRDETISAFHKAVSDNEDSEDEDIGGGLLTLREKTKDELEREEEDYRAYLEREVGSVKDLLRLVDVPEPHADDETQTQTNVKDAGPSDTTENGTKKKKKSKKSQDQGEQSDQDFLINYILNRGWIDRESRHLPTYSEITGVRTKPEPELASTAGGGKDANGADAEELPELHELEEFEDVADHFESMYNFRFEEPGAQVIQRHPRNVETTVRRDDTSRKEARERRKARKQEEVMRKTEEVKRLKALKMREIRKKLDLVSKEGGIAPEELGELDLGGEWDPEKHDAQMASLYAEDAIDPDEDLEKPVWNDDIDISDIVPSERKSKKQKKKEERRKAKARAEAAETNEAAVDEDAMDADAVQPQQSYLDDEEEWDGTEEMRKRKLAEYMDEVYALEFNDVIGGDLATRFKYTPVEGSSFHLTPAEVLLATDAELNQYMGVKKYAPYRKGKERWDGSKAERLKEIKETLKTRSWGGVWEVGGDASGDTDAGEKKKRRKGKKERERAKMVAVPTPSGEDTTGTGIGEKRVMADHGEESGPGKKKRRRRSTASEPSELKEGL